ncbi:hypothetical protein [Teredinibacter franksiae]|uniref:hypothetical protein n=1 Tax=Teredinibacter franksiae TaxID=2761453 RepID=UPI00162803E3|nr:hypothetical protein [Teredinibacter franksiae]
MTDSKTDKASDSLEAEAKKKSGESEERSMCRHGFHDWMPIEDQPADDAGKPVSMLKCTRCGKEKLDTAE